MTKYELSHDDRVAVAVRLDNFTSAGWENDVCVYASNDNETIHVNTPYEMFGVIGNSSFRFDKVFGELDDEVVVYEESVQPLVEHAIRGHNAAVFCYCDNEFSTLHSLQTSSTCWNTLLSSEELLFRALTDLIAYKESVATETLVKLAISVVEVYGDEIMDLLGSESKIIEFNDATEEVKLNGATMLQVSNIDDIVQLLKRIQSFRTNSQNHKNHINACSHVVYFIDVLQSSKSATKNCTKDNTVRSEMERDVVGVDADSNVVTVSKHHSRLVFVDLAISRCMSENSATTLNATEMESVNSTLTILARAITALHTHSKHIPYRKCTLTKLLRHTFTDHHSRVLLLGQIVPRVRNIVSTLRILSFCNKIKQLSVTAERDSKEQDINLQSYLQSLRTNEELMSEMHILKEEHRFSTTSVHLLSEIRKEPTELTRQRVVEELKASLPIINTHREVEEMRELELQAARERDEEVEKFVLHMNNLIEEYDLVMKSIKSEKKKLKKQKEERAKGIEKIDKGSGANDSEKEVLLMHEAKKAKKARLKLEAEVNRLKNELSAAQTNTTINDANAAIASETETKRYYDEDIDSETNGTITANRSNKNVLAVPTAVVAIQNKDSSSMNGSKDNFDSTEWDEFLHTFVSSFFESATEINKLHMQYVLRLLASLRLRLRVKRLRVSSSDIMTEGTLMADLIDFLIARAVNVAEQIVQPNSPWSWKEIDGRSTHLLSAQEMCPPLLPRHAVMNKTKHTGLNDVVATNELRYSQRNDEEKKEEEEETLLLQGESKRQRSNSLRHPRHHHHHNHRHSTFKGALHNDNDSDKSSNTNHKALGEIAELDLIEPVEYHKITFLSSDESDEENSHHAAESRRAGLQGNMASFTQFSINENNIDNNTNEEEDDKTNMDDRMNKRDGGAFDKEEIELEANTHDNTSISKKNRKRRDSKKKHRRGTVDMANVEYSSSNFDPLSLQHEYTSAESAGCNADFENKTSSVELFDTENFNLVNTFDPSNVVKVNTLVPANETEYDNNNKVNNHVNDVIDDDDDDAGKEQRNENNDSNQEEEVEIKETRHKHRKHRRHHHHHNNNNSNNDNNNNINHPHLQEHDNDHNDESGNVNPGTQQSSSENAGTSDENSNTTATRHSIPAVISVPPSLITNEQRTGEESNSQINSHSHHNHEHNNSSSLESSSSSAEVQANSSTLASEVAKTNDETAAVKNESASNGQQGSSGNFGVNHYMQRREDMLYLMDVYDSPTLVQDLLKFLRTGTVMIKHGRQGKPHKRLFWINTINNKRELLWMKQDGLGNNSSNSNSTRSSINLSEVRYIQLGCFSKVFKRHPISSTDPAFFRCFSLGLRSTDRTIDVVADSVPDFEAWVVGLAHLIGVDPAWGGKLDVTKDPTFTHLTFFESSLCESNYIQPRDYLIVKKTVQQRAAYTARVLSECGNDAKKAFDILGGIHAPAIDSKGALYITKGELRFLIPQLCLDIFRITQIWILLQQMNLVFDDKFLPATAFGFTLR